MLEMMSLGEKKWRRQSIGKEGEGCPPIKHVQMKKFPRWVFNPPMALTLAGVLLLLVGLIFQFYGLDAITYQKLQKDSVLVNGSAFYERWSKPETGHIRVFIFNVTNPDGVMKGEDPILHEVGPYVYDYTVSKTDLEETEPDNLQYRLSYHSEFNANLSKTSETDQVTIMNYPLIATVHAGLATGQNVMEMVKSAIEKIFPNQESPFITASVREILFDGMPLDCSSRNHLVFLVCRQLTVQGPQFFWLDENRVTRFALLHSRNKSSLDLYNVHTGANDVNQRGQIRKFRNETSVSHWKGDFCNRVNGSSDGSNAYPTHLTKDSRLYYFEADFGRLVFADFTESKMFEDITIYRFEANEKLFAYDNPENFCFCPRNITKKDEEEEPINCPPNGLLNMALFTYAPLMISFPWFLHGSPELQTVLPNTSNHKHEDLVTFLEIEPLTGVPIRGAKRFQFNMLLPQVSNFAYLSQVREKILPGLWAELLLENDRSSIAEVKNAFFELQVLQGIIYAAIGCGVTLALAFGVLLVIQNKQSMKTGSYNGSIRAISLTQKAESPKDDNNKFSNTDTYQRHFM